MTTLTVLNKRHAFNHQFWKINYTNQNLECVTSNVIEINLPHEIIFNDKGIVFKIKASADMALKMYVDGLEKEADALIKNLDEKQVQELPEDCRIIHSTKIEQQDWISIRPNYYYGEIMFLKGNYKSLSIHDLHKPQQILSPNGLGYGFYKFKISTDTLYIGQHENKNFIANVQLRITEIHYSPFSPDTVTPSPLSFIEDLFEGQPTQDKQVTKPVVTKPQKNRKKQQQQSKVKQ